MSDERFILDPNKFGSLHPGVLAINEAVATTTGDQTYRPDLGGRELFERPPDHLSGPVAQEVARLIGNGREFRGSLRDGEILGFLHALQHGALVGVEVVSAVDNAPNRAVGVKVVINDEENQSHAVLVAADLRGFSGQQETRMPTRLDQVYRSIIPDNLRLDDLHENSRTAANIQLALAGGLNRINAATGNMPQGERHSPVDAEHDSLLMGLIAHNLRGDISDLNPRDYMHSAHAVAHRPGATMTEKLQRLFASQTPCVGENGGDLSRGWISPYPLRLLTLDVATRGPHQVVLTRDMAIPGETGIFSINFNSTAALAGAALGLLPVAHEVRPNTVMDDLNRMAGRDGLMGIM